MLRAVHKTSITSPCDRIVEGSLVPAIRVSVHPTRPRTLHRLHPPQFSVQQQRRNAVKRRHDGWIEKNGPPTTIETP
jgi:hypothetical protein